MTRPAFQFLDTLPKASKAPLGIFDAEEKPDTRANEGADNVVGIIAHEIKHGAEYGARSGCGQESRAASCIDAATPGGHI